mmetsp:Transcript_41412/g.97029  ORF Transcript_41412/g.97029 Transcript_41412/m.97029 type:complete len:428 (-) Transcript_41412:797-2080(-)
MRSSLLKIAFAYVCFLVSELCGAGLQFTYARDTINNDGKGEKLSDLSNAASSRSSVGENPPGSCLSDENDPSSSNENVDKALQFRFFLEHMFDIVDSSGGKGRGHQDHVIVSALLEYFEMEPSLFQKKITKQNGNWMEILYDNVKALAPPEFFKVWGTKRPTKEEVDIIVAIDNDALEKATVYNPDDNSSFVDEDKLLSRAFTPFRHRGFIPELLNTFSRVIMSPLKSVAYAIPSNEVLDEISQYAPLIEVGAGTGYWSALLKEVHEVTIQPYDAKPPNTDSKDDKNVYFNTRSHTYTDVFPGECDWFFFSHEDRYAKDHTLLMIWPNNPDNVDNDEEFHIGNLPPLWDSDCLSAFIHAGGTSVIYVGERIENIYHLPDKPPEVGLCASAKFQSMLKEKFVLKKRMNIPSWTYDDDVTFWTLKEKIK